MLRGSSGDFISVVERLSFDIVEGSWASDGSKTQMFYFLKGVWGLFANGHQGLGI
jgi:hypothetical protein